MQIFHLKLFQLRQVQAKKPCHEGVQSSRLGRFFVDLSSLLLQVAGSGMAAAAVQLSLLELQLQVN